MLVSLFVLFEFFVNSENKILQFTTGQPSYAATKDWDGGGDGESWNDPLNWNPDGVPASGDDVYIDVSDTVYLPSQAGDSLLHHWTLDENAGTTDVADSFTDGNGTASQNTSSMTTTGKVGSAFSFNGSSDYIDFGDLNTTSDDIISVSAWVQFNDLTGHQAIYTDGGNSSGFEFGLYNDELHIGIENANSHRSLGYSTAGLSTGTWYHVVAVAIGTQGDLFIYVDGSLVASNTALSNFTSFDGTDGTWIGSVGGTSPTSNDNPAGTTAYYFNGVIDNVKVFNEALSAIDISYLYNSGSGRSNSQLQPESLTIQSLTLGNGSGTTSPILSFSYDASGSANNLDISGGNLTVNTSATITHTASESDKEDARIDINVDTGSATISGTVDADASGFIDGGIGYGGNIALGASHGGTGGSYTISSSSDIYGSITNPVTLGSATPAHVGGGAVKIYSAGNMIIDGTVSANGQTAGLSRGGAAGGSVILITDSQLSGSGTISADGGESSNGRGGGGGGRIAVTYSTVSGAQAISAYGGFSSGNYNYGGAGTVYISDTTSGTDQLIVDNNDQEPTANNDVRLGVTPLTPVGTPLTLAVDEVIVRNQGHLVINSDTDLKFNSSLTWNDDGNIHDNGGNLYDGSTGGDPNDGPFEAGYDVTIPSGATLYGNTPKTINSLTVNGTLTHSTNKTTGDGQLYDIDYVVTVDATVNSGGVIDISGRGYDNGEGPGACSNTNCGGSHGGTGSGYNQTNGYAGDVYGSVTAPETIGSAGGYEGGGAVKLDIGNNFYLFGTVIADGRDGEISQGGGAGGSVYFIVGGDLDGTSGSITADGGTGNNNRGGGGGGRISITYDTMSVTPTMQAYGGTSAGTWDYRFGGAGTIYISDTTSGVDQLIIDNNNSDSIYNYDWEYGKTPLTPVGTPLTLAVDEIIVRNEGDLVLNSDTDLTYNTSFTWNDDGNVHDNGGNLYDGSTGGDLNDGPFEAGYDVTIPVGSRLFGNTDKTLLSLTINGVLTHSNNSTTAAGQVYDINYAITNDVTLASGAEIDISQRGYYQGGQGPGAASVNTGGAGHGGTGSGYQLTIASGGDVYGSVKAPVTIGSSGGYEGGGAVKLDVSGDIDVSGNIYADGRDGISSQGGGAGGSIYLITAQQISGNGTIAANGGVGSNSRGGGGGGRISITYATTTGSRTVTAYGGSTSTDYRFGGAGTVYISDTTSGIDQLIIDNNDLATTRNYNWEHGKTPLTPTGTPLTLSVDEIIVRNQGHLVINSDTDLTFNSSLTWNDDGNIYDEGGNLYDGSTGGDLNDGPFEDGYPLTIPAGATLYGNTAKSFTTLDIYGTLTHSNNSTTAAGKVYWINYTITGVFKIWTGGEIDIAGRGYAEMNGPGVPGQNIAGAAHGGAGGSIQNGASGGTVYGSVTAPITLGSGGGTGSGGGAISISTSDDIELDGPIYADGEDATAFSGGAGGSIYISTTTGEIAGAQPITANAGDTSASWEGSGGGRIAIVYSGLENPDRVHAYGATSNRSDYFGGAGTIYFSDTTLSETELIIDNNGVDNRDDRWYGKTPLTPSGTPDSFTFTTVTTRNDGHLDLNSDTTITLTDNNWNGIIEDNGGTMTNVTSGDLVINANGIFVANTARSVTSVTLNGELRHSKNQDAEDYKIDLTTTGNFTTGFLAPDINLLGLGYESGGPGAGENSGGYGSGAGHGGVGGVTIDAGSTGGSTYDSETSPINIGSNGGPNLGDPGDGGGAIKLTVGGDLSLYPDINVDGQDATGESGGASGGAIWLAITGQFNGTGNLSSNGGNAVHGNAGSGAGGRIRYECASGAWSGTATADGGTVGGPGGAGTISTACSLNASPTIDTVRVGTTANGTNVSPLTLTANTTTTYYINGTVSDTDGYADIIDVDARLYRSGATGGVACTADDNDCYIQATCSLTGGSGDSVNYSCQVDLQYFADPTDTGTYSADTWNVRVSATDSVDTVHDDTYTNEINTLSAINIPGDVAHGNVSLGATIDGTTLTVNNAGNVDVNLDLSMASDISCTIGTIPIANNKYDLSDVAYASLTYTLSSTPATLDVDLPQQTNDGVQVSDTIYWGIQIPASEVGGSCSGTITATAN